MQLPVNIRYRDRRIHLTREEKTLVSTRSTNHITQCHTALEDITNPSTSRGLSAAGARRRRGRGRRGEARQDETMPNDLSARQRLAVRRGEARVAGYVHAARGVVV